MPYHRKTFLDFTLHLNLLIDHLGRSSHKITGSTTAHLHTAQAVPRKEASEYCDQEGVVDGSEEVSLVDGSMFITVSAQVTVVIRTYSMAQQSIYTSSCGEGSSRIFV